MKLSFPLLFLSLTLFTNSSWAVSADQVALIKLTMQVDANSPLEVRVAVPANHHFNIKAPNEAFLVLKKSSNGFDSKLMAKLDLSLKTVKAVWKADVKNSDLDNCEIQTKLFVCDDANTYCLPKKSSYDCSGKELIAAAEIVKSPLKFKESGKVEAAEILKVRRSTEFDDSLFIDEDIAKAMALARKENRILFIEFGAIWCPPCNELEETVFNQPKFKKFKNDFVFLRFDVDKASSWEWKSKYQIQGYPTVIMAKANGEEISRVVGARRPVSMFKQMNLAIKNKRRSADQVSDNDRGLQALDRADYSEALAYFVKASKRWTATDPKRNNLLTAIIGVQEDLIKKEVESKDEKAVERKKSQAALLVLAIEWFPFTVQAMERIEKLSDLAEDFGDKTMSKKATDLSLKIAQGLLKNPKSYQDEDVTAGDIYEFLGTSYEASKNQVKARENYKKAADEYYKMIKLSGLDEKNERGYNLERVYCIWKSGNFDEAGKLYSGLQAIYPEEFTFYYQNSKMLMDQKLWTAALDKAQIAFKYSYGDNKLRVTLLIAELYKNMGKPKDGVKFLDQVLADFKAPEDSKVRTTFYIAKLRKFKTDLEASPIEKATSGMK